MWNWITDNIGTILICLVLIAIVTAIIISMVKKKRAANSMVC